MALTDAEKALIKESWEEYLKGDLIDQGVYMFLRIFKEHQDLKHLWRFSEDADTYEVYIKSPRLRFHIKRLFAHLRIVVDGLELMPELEDGLEDLGRRHNKFKVTKAHHGAVADGLIFALSRALGNKFTPEARAAWTKLYQWIAEIMNRTMNDP